VNYGIAGSNAVGTIAGGKAVSESVILTIGAADVTDGTLVIDMWYTPITDDGALAAA